MSRLVHAFREEMSAIVLPWRILLLQPIISTLPYMMLLRTRTWLYRLSGLRIGQGTVILGTLRLWGKNTLTVGRYCTINTPCAINLDADVVLGDNVYIGNDVLILTVTHQVGNQYCRAGTAEAYPVRIEDGVWIAARATILPGITIGAGSIVAAGAMVTKNVPPHTLVAGVPAVPRRSLPIEEEISVRPLL
ncbi:MAG: acyltransferase [Armatimonadota bacterium]